MSLIRLVIWSSLIGGWAAFTGWLISEIPFHAWIDQGGTLATVLAIVMATFVAIAIGGGVSAASGLTNPQWQNLLRRFLLGCAGGLLGGLLGTLLGVCAFGILQNVPVLGYLSRVMGWTLIGLGIGVTEGIFDRNIKKMRNGLIGGVIGGFLAGLFFTPVGYIFSPMSSRAFAFVLLGLFIGLFIGLAQVVLKEAWLTVEDGFRPGRQMILGTDLVTMGTSEKSSLIFIAFGAKGVEPTHLKITRQPDGRYLLEDNQSRTGTLLNGQAITAPTPMNDGDAIQFGVNVVRFSERAKRGDAQRLPSPALKEPAKPMPAPVVPAKAPAPTPVPASAVKAAPPKPAAVAPAKAPSPPAAAAAKAPTPKPKPAPTMEAAPAPKKAAPAQPQEGRCPICDKKVVGIPGERRCAACFSTF